MARLQRPGEPAHQAVDGVVALGLIEGSLGPDPVELVAAVGQAVRPRSQYLPPAAVGPLIGSEAVDDGPRPHGVGPQRGADLADDDVVTPVPDAPLLAGRRGNGYARGGRGHGAVN